jgi:hypothetical protein
MLDHRDGRSKRGSLLPEADCSMVDVAYPKATTICVAQDKFNTYTAGALHEAFPPAEARHIPERLRFHYTPKHGSWLNQAEIELAIFARGCLSRGVGEREALRRRIAVLKSMP